MLNLRVTKLAWKDVKSKGNFYGVEKDEALFKKFKCICPLTIFAKHSLVDICKFLDMPWPKIYILQSFVNHTQCRSYLTFFNVYINIFVKASYVNVDGILS